MVAADNHSTPRVTIAVPTFRRPALLLRAIESVRAQTWMDWELLVSDDEDPSGEAWTLLEALAAVEPRLRITRNPGPHKEVGNVNHLLREARGQWIKILHDDDRLRPECLETMLRAADAHPSAALVTCQAFRVYRGGSSPNPSSDRVEATPVEIIPQRLVHLGMYLLDVTVGLPTQVMVRRSIIAGHGIYYENRPGIHYNVDTWWSLRVLCHGDLVIVRRRLVEWHQGEHESMTRSLVEVDLDAEFALLRDLLHERIDPALRPPAVPVVRQMMRVIRAANRIKQRRPAEALRMAASVWRPRAWWLAGRWALAKRWPERFYAVPRVRHLVADSTASGPVAT